MPSRPFTFLDHVPEFTRSSTKGMSGLVGEASGTKAAVSLLE